MSRVYVAPLAGDGLSPATAFRPAIPEGTDGVFHRMDELFLVATDADLTGVAGVTELTGDAIDEACTTCGIDRSALGVDAP